ncbi:MAG: ABC transporter ATP-binding protein [Nitrososphaerota archaeon]
MLEIIDLWKIYKTRSIEYPALRGVNLRLERGEFLAVVGPSGSGKTTLLNLIGALDVPTRGEIILDGVSYGSVGKGGLVELRRNKIGFIFQTYNLLSQLTSLENVELPLIAQGVSPRVRRERAMKLLERLGLAEKADKKPWELSGGEQQRVAIARALINNPSLILADEPTGNLDSKNAVAVAALLREVNEVDNKTIVLVTHNMEVARYAERIVYLKDGTIEKEEVVGK